MGGAENSGRLPAIELPENATRDRVTGSHIYAFFKCEHSVYLEFFGDRERKLAPGKALEHLLARGRDFEAKIVAELDYREPEFEKGDFEEAARQTLSFLEEGVVGVSQGVLRAPPYLGVPDLLRREPGKSRFGDYHYVVGDIKSSWRPRSDQALQVAFYTRMLAELQGRDPGYGYLILRDGREERIDTALLAPVLDEILEELSMLLLGQESSRPHRSYACRACSWRDLCAEQGGVDWIPGLTRTVRSLLAAEGYHDAQSLQAVEARKRAQKGPLPAETWRRARWAAQAVCEGRAVELQRPRTKDLVGNGVAAWIARDGFDERYVLFASQERGGEPRVHFARTLEEEESAAKALLQDLESADGSVVHSGALPAALHGFVPRLPALATRLAQIEKRCVSLMSLYRGAYAFPAPVQTPGEVLGFLEGRGAMDAEDPRDLLALHAMAEDRPALLRLASEELSSLLSLLQGLEA